MASDSGSQNSSCRIMTFYPTKEEFQNFIRYMAYIESQGAHKAGLAKIVPPKDWKPRKCYDDIDELVIPAPIQQVVTGQSGLFTQYNIQKKPMTVREFRKIANSDKYCNPRYDDFEELERKYWKNLTFNPPIYGADVNGTLYDPDINEWNIGRLNTILDTVEKESGITIEGVNTPYLYFGMWKTTFAWHTEDMDLYSINYLHFGEPKSWYTVPPEHGKRLERLAKGFFPGSSQNCEAFLRHKMTLISPSILKKYGIPFDKITQEAGEFMITFPYGYHAGFNHGFNCAESTNFATRRWIEYGKQAILCSCRKDMVKISMDVFVRKFQPERYKLWKAGKDNPVIDHSLPTPEAAEFMKEDLGNDEHLNSIASCTEESKDTETGKKSVSKHRIGTKRHRVCLEVPQELLPKEEFGSLQCEPAVPKEVDIIFSHQDNPTEVDCDEDTCIKDSCKTENIQEEDIVKLKNENSVQNIVTKELIVPSEVSEYHFPLGDTPKECDTTMPIFTEGMLTLLSEKCKKMSENNTPFLQNLSTEETPDMTPKPSLSTNITSISTDSIIGQSYTKEECEESGEDSIAKSKESSILTSVHTPDMEEIDEEDTCSVTETKIIKSKRQPLSKLPRHHPLIKDCFSDEEMQEQVILEEDISESEPWTKSLANLWQTRPHNFQAEREYNENMGLHSPYCAVCMIFQTFQQLECKSNCQSHKKDSEGRLRTKPLIPEMCFASNEDSSEFNFSAPYLEEDGTSLLISCSNCLVRVHTSCYGVAPEKISKNWICARCEANAMTEGCCLCSLRGGALQRANNDKWVHVLCAVAVLEARFVNIADRSPVDLSGIPLQRFKLKCYYCKKRVKRTAGCCVQCSHGRCPTSFHATCAQAAGVLMQPDDWPFVVFITCYRHKGSITTQRNKAIMQELSVGQKVICKHKNGRYYQCEVIKLTKETFYEVNFDDGSFSDNLFPEDIVSRDCVHLGPPEEGEVVQVRWTDGLVYGAKFVAAHVIQMYQVEFEDGSQLTVKRDDVYTLEEELPKRVKTRLSFASDMRFDGIFADKEFKQETKRQRVINSRYRGDYIEPVVYRAIME
ncbi:lysine-specific demethylase 4A [Erpetoichthys calabaricus]|uniref:[histone H3]-trimethyl-L-lysine(9) demethylase n=1 Tax=Erpetoichthys calabaricus TaxID=27687 RepID=A0A8C4SBT6_ERPCA|nr:lysine-specific demethylase 4A [Erpetoichthys calabaricus]XP_051789201.1 lysine-specific demethylase 4A [Erpetoichthys calabaricus]